MLEELSPGRIFLEPTSDLNPRFSASSFAVESCDMQFSGQCPDDTT